ncbi:UPF0147 family protein [Candidatus Bathyarchaeota archaeon]|nr:UPF0147 family protein [Candidatus Bathyarchaeota archaeon]MBS7612788.1 UPF0147 family protein [Candidatus Bathyarchaeota archaeon]MBS7617313.1 UPF0147 family protein [Candidatus Bathyarchaeota archaeon]
MDRVNKAIQILQLITSDPTTPRNIRKAAKESIDQLQSDKLSLAARASNVIDILDEISQDPNIPVYTRTKIWQAISFLEGIRD